MPDKNNALGIRLPTWPAVTVLIGLTLAFYYGLWLPGLVLIHRDAFRFYLPIKQHLTERLSASELPQWFPYDALGRPFIGIAASGVFHPFTMLYLFLPVHDAYRLSVLISCLLAGLGAYTLAHVLRCSRAAALIAGLAFSLSGYVVSLTFNIVYLYSIAVLPFFCAALEKALARRRVWLIAPAVIWATVFLNGDVQTGYYYGFIALLWTVSRAACSYREAALRLALASSLAALLAGVQLGPTAGVFAGSDRSHSETIHDEAIYWSTHPLRLTTILASPLAIEIDPVELGRAFFSSPDHGFWAESLYLGVPVTVLAFAGAWYRRDLRVLVLLGVFALLLALGRYGGMYEFFSAMVPLWSAFRFPEKFMGVVSFAAAMLAGAGLDAFRAGKGRLSPWLVVAILCAGAWLALRTEAASELTIAALDSPPDLTRTVIGSAGHAFLFSAAAALGMWLILTGARRGYLREPVFLGALVLLMTLDLVRANLEAYHTGPAETATFIPPLATALAAREGAITPGRFRTLTFHDAAYVVPPAIRHLFGHDSNVVERRQALDVAHNAQFHLESLFAYLPARNPALKTVIPYLDRIDIAARFNTAYYIARRAHFQNPVFAHEIVAVLPDYDLALVHNPVPVKARAYLSLHPEHTTSPVDPIALIRRPDFLNGDVDVIETTHPTLRGPALGSVAVIEHYAPEEVRVHVETPQPATLILLDAYDQGWTATLESGGALPILRANALVRAVVVPAGTHMVTFRYETPLLRAGASASLAGCLICLAMIARTRWGTRKSQSTP